MTALIIVLSIIAIIALLMLLPITVELAFENQLFLRVKYAGFVVYDNKKQKKHGEKEKKKQGDEASKKGKKENFFKKTYKQRGLLGTVKYFAALLQIILKKLLWIVKKFRFRQFSMDLTVSSENAANTAIEYGSICSVFYPLLTFIETNLDFKHSQVNILTDFNKINSQFKISFAVTVRLSYMLIAVVATFVEYLKLQRKENKTNE